MCGIGLNDGVTNNPQCNCCNAINPMYCNDVSGCAPLFDSCVVNDKVRGLAYQVGGTSGVAAFNTILCFNVSSNAYTSNSGSIHILQSKSSGNVIDPLCPFVTMTASAFDVGCDLMQDLHNSIIIAGGRMINGTFLNTIQLCEPNQQPCQVQQLTLPQPMSQVQVVSLNECNFVVFGGLTNSITHSNTIYIGDICLQQWVYNETMPAQLSQFGLALGKNVLCIVGGVGSNNLIQNSVFCTPFTPPNTFT